MGRERETGEEVGEEAKDIGEREVTADAQPPHLPPLGSPSSRPTPCPVSTSGIDGGTYQCKGPVGGQNWPERNPQGRDKWGLRAQRHGCGQGTGSRGCSQPRPCRTPLGRLRNREKSGGFRLFSTSLSRAPIPGWFLFSPEMEPPALGPLFPSLRQRLFLPLNWGGIAFPLMETVRWAGVMGRPTIGVCRLIA